MHNDNITDIAAQKIIDYVDKEIKKAPFDKTYNGIISDILFNSDTDIKDSNFGMYLVKYGNTEKKIKITDGLVHSIGERVKVCIEENNPNNVSVESIVKRILPKEITYKNGTVSGNNTVDEDTITEIREIKTNNQTYRIKSVFKIEVKNRDTETEEVTKMTFPDGSVVKFTGWDV